MSALVPPSDRHVLEQLVEVFWRRWKLVLLFVVLGLIAASLYAATLPPRYSASATVMVRSGFALDPVRQGSQTITPEEEGLFLSQLELARSSVVAARVAEKLNIENDPDFIRPPKTALERFLEKIPMRLDLRHAEPEKLTRETAIARLQSSVGTSRVGRTYVAAISYSHTDPAVAQKVAQAFADAFVEKLKIESDSARARVKEAIDAEIAKASPEQRAALEAKYQDIVVSHALPGVDAVVISDARKPAGPVSPRIPFIAVVGTIVGLALGCVLAGLREASDRGVRDGDHLARRLGTRFLGYLPAVPAYRRSATQSSGREFTAPADARRAVTEPYSRFSETLRSASTAAELTRAPGGGLVIGVISTLPGEGKTLVAANLAAQFTGQGRQVLLIDGHLRDPDLTGWLVGRADAGLIDCVMVERPLSECVVYDSKSGINLLPVSVDRATDPLSLWHSEKFKLFLDRCGENYDTIIVDLPALTVASDAMALETYVNGFVLVTEWGEAPEELIDIVLSGEPRIRSKLLGVMLSKTKLRKLSRYVSATSRGAFQYRIG